MRERISASGTVKKADRVAIERKNARGGVEAAVDIVKQGSETGRRILVAGSEVVKRLEPSAGVPDPSRAAHKHPNTFPIVGSRGYAVRVGTYRLRHRQKREAASRSGMRSDRSCFRLNHGFMFFPFLFSR